MSFLTKSLPRRTLLRGLGATMALPFLEAMLPPFSLKGLASSTPVHRFQAFYTPNGMAMEYWTPKGEGNAFELSPILEPMAPFKNQMLVLSGLLRWQENLVLSFYRPHGLVLRHIRRDGSWSALVLERPRVTG